MSPNSNNKSHEEPLLLRKSAQEERRGDQNFVGPSNGHANVIFHEKSKFHNNDDGKNNRHIFQEQRRAHDNMFSQQEGFKDTEMKTFFFYIVYNNEIVGRYGANLIDALSHLRILSGKSRIPDNSRALIPVINRRICHPFELLSSLPLQEYILQRNKEHGLNKQLLFQIMKCCHWTNNYALQCMQYIVQREHRILQPAIYSKSQIRCNSNVVISLPTLGRNGKKDFSSRVRSKCLEFLNELKPRGHLDERGSNVHVVVRDDD